MKRLAAVGAAIVAVVMAACVDSPNPLEPGKLARVPTGPRPAALPSTSDGPTTGAIFTTNSACNGTNVNIFATKADVYLDGGPVHPGAAGLADGYYAVKVTDPSGAVLLGTTVGTTDEAPVHVTNGEFDQCYQLTTILRRGSTDVSGGAVAPDGYDDTPNSGGEYKVWVSNGSDFVVTKTDNFKVQSGDTPCDGCVFETATLRVRKFYDANANGINDDGQLITGWRILITDGTSYVRFTPVNLVVEPDDYLVTESSPIEANWFSTTTNPVNVHLDDGDDKTVYFGNVCTGAGGGLTLGYWSNKNGGKVIANQGLLAGVLALHLRKADGTLLGSVDLATFQKFLLEASATNMANMLSAQLAAMWLNVQSGGVAGTALIYAPGTNSANALGFATVNAVMAEAEALLASADPLVILAGNPDRPRAEALKTALDNGNNNLNFVQATPCAFSFAPLD